MVLSRSLEAQIRSLVADPIRRTLLDEKDAMSLRSGPKLIIIDGLDECGTAKVQRYILSVLATAFQQIPLPISFLIASRPEQINNPRHLPCGTLRVNDQTSGNGWILIDPMMIGPIFNTR